MPILEKAFAKFHGNYKHIIGGDPKISAKTLAGAPHRVEDHIDMTEDAIWDMLVKANAENDLIQSSTPGKDDTDGAGTTGDDGVVPGHAYTLLDTVTLSDGTRLIKLRNPWGSDNYQKDWGDNSDKWTD